jgi:hypothetical protein
MDETTVLKHVKQLHREIEIDDGKDPSLVTDDAQPLDDLPGFDSPLIPNVVRQLAKMVGIVIPKGTRLKNPYVDANNKKLSLRQVAKRFCELYGKMENSV